METLAVIMQTHHSQRCSGVGHQSPMAANAMYGENDYLKRRSKFDWKKGRDTQQHRDGERRRRVPSGARGGCRARGNPGPRGALVPFPHAGAPGVAGAGRGGAWFA